MQWPHLVLEVPEDTSDDDVRAAYQRKVRECPPERDPERFSAIQRAYELVKDTESRARLNLLGLDEPPRCLAELVPDSSRRRGIIPREAWLKEL